MPAYLEFLGADTMQRWVTFGALITAGLTASTSCGERQPGAISDGFAKDSAVHAVVVSPDSVKLNSGDGWQLAASIDAGALVQARTVKWSSSSPTVAAVTESGMVTAGTTAGVAIITATSSADTTVKGTSKIVVIQP